MTQQLTQQLTEQLETLQNNINTTAIKERVSENAKMVERTVLSKTSAEKLAKGLGWFSLGLGTAELLAPRMVANVCGMPGRNTFLIRLFGLREIAAGVGIFSEGTRPAGSMWFRVAGDMVDLMALGSGLLSPRTNKMGVLFGITNVLAVTALDVIAAQDLSRKKGIVNDSGQVCVRKSLFIRKSPEECYEAWKNFESFPVFMRHLVSVTSSNGNGRSHWVAKAPAGRTIEWDAEVTSDVPNQLIAWQSLPGAEVPNQGSVRFEPAPGRRGTYVNVEISYGAPGGVIGATVARMFREEPLPQLKDDLRRFKQMIEIGEVVLSDGSPEGNGQIKQRAARPVPQQ